MVRESLRHLTLHTYRWLSRGRRQRLAQRFTRENRWPAAILFYHRVADRIANPWSLTNADFRRHLDLIARLGTFASLDELRADQVAGRHPSLRVAITFDDGYAENLERALPELVARRIPCTYFVSTAFVGNRRPFPHDQQRARPLPTHSIDEIRRIAEMGIEIGGHTETHLDLGQPWPTARLRREIADSRKQLQDWSCQPVNYFAFPYGTPRQLSQAAIDVVAEAGYQAFLSAYGAWFEPGQDDFHLPRIHGEPGTASLLNWLTLDPRKFDQPVSWRYVRPAAAGRVAPMSDVEKAPAQSGVLAPLSPAIPFAASSFPVTI